MSGRCGAACRLRHEVRAKWLPSTTTRGSTDPEGSLGKQRHGGRFPGLNRRQKNELGAWSSARAAPGVLLHQGRICIAHRPWARRAAERPLVRLGWAAIPAEIVFMQLMHVDLTAGGSRRGRRGCPDRARWRSTKGSFIPWRSACTQPAQRLRCTGFEIPG